MQYCEVSKSECDFAYKNWKHDKVCTILSIRKHSSKIAGQDNRMINIKICPLKEKRCLKPANLEKRSVRTVRKAVAVSGKRIKRRNNICSWY